MRYLDFELVSDTYRARVALYCIISDFAARMALNAPQLLTRSPWITCLDDARDECAILNLIIDALLSLPLPGLKANMNKRPELTS